MWRYSWRPLCVGAMAVVLLPINMHATTYELRGLGILPSGGPFGVPGESITVTLALDSDDFAYVRLPNPIFHYFLPITTIPVEIVGSVSGAYPNVSPISRFVALELEDSSGGDQIGLDVSVGSFTTQLLTLTTDGFSGFNGDVTPFTPPQLFTLFEEAMQNVALWDRSAASAVFVPGEDFDNLLTLGSLHWSLIEIESLEGDFDGDADVDGRDFVIWQRGESPNPLSADDLADWQANYWSLIGPNEPLDGDFDLDGDVDGRDFLIWQRNPNVGSLTDWQANYGSGPLVATSLAVPEPASACLLSLAVLGVLTRYKRCPA